MNWSFVLPNVNYCLCRVSIHWLKYSLSLLSSRPRPAHTSVHRGFLRQPVCHDGSSWDERIPDQPGRLPGSHLTADERCSCCCLRTLTDCKYSRISESYKRRSSSSLRIFIHIFHLSLTQQALASVRMNYPPPAVGCTVFFWCKVTMRNLSTHPVFP